jgi:hypothetical protein
LSIPAVLSHVTLSYASKYYRILQALSYLPVLVFALLGLRRCLGQPYRTASCYAVHSLMLMTFISALIYYGSDRFRDARMPSLVIHAALGLTTFRQQMHGERRFREPRLEYRHGLALD